MELNNFIKKHNITSYIDLKNILEREPYNLKIKEDNNYKNLFLIHNCSNSDFNNKIVNECNGIILDKNTLKIICYSFDKCSDEKNIPKNIDIENLFIQYSIEGSLIRLYNYDDKWMISTKKCIDSSKSKWISNKSFVELFYDCLGDLDLEDFINPNCCYSFIISHPENNIINKNCIPKLYHVSTRLMTTLQEVSQNIGLPFLEKNSINHNIQEFIKDLTLQLSTDTEKFYEGYMFIDIHYNRWKLQKPYFTNLRELWGNNNNRFFRYLELRKDVNLLEKYLNYFEYDKLIFLKYEKMIYNLVQVIGEYYSKKHISKVNKNVPFYFSKIIYKLHGDYFKTKIKTNHNKIMLYLFELEPKEIYFMINKYKEEVDKEIIIKNNYDEKYVDMEI